jgi:hypothetical protein
MGELRVFDMEGRAAYPSDAGSDGRMASYFSERVFALQSGEENGGPIVEAYFSARTAQGKPNNYSLRYYGDAPERLFRNCREAIQRELVDGLGWTIERPRSGPASVFADVIWDPDGGAGSATGQLFGQFGLDEDQQRILRDMPSNDDDAPPVRITASGYGEVTGAIPAFLSSGYTVVVSRERTAPPEWADVQFRPSDSLYSGLELHGSTEEYIQEQKSEYIRRQRDEKFEEVGAALTALDELDAERENVSEQLSSALGTTFPELRILSEDELRSQREQAREQGRKAAAKEAGSSSNGSGTLVGKVSGFLSGSGGVTESRILMAAALVVLILAGGMLAPSLPIPFGQDDGNSELRAEVVGTNSTAVTLNISGGPGADYNVTLANETGNVRTRTVASGSGTVTTTFVGLAPANYTISVRSQSATAEDTVRLRSAPTATPTTTATEAVTPTPTEEAPPSPLRETETATATTTTETTTATATTNSTA